MQHPASQVPRPPPSKSSSSSSSSSSPDPHVAPELTDKPPSNSLINLLVMATLNSLRAELIKTALFFAERLHALIPSSELSVWLLALCLLRSGDGRATVHLLRNTPVFIPITNALHSHKIKGKAKSTEDDPFSFRPFPQASQAANDQVDDSLWDWNHHASTRGIQRIANMASTRCALVYSKACNLINRPKEGLEVYLKAIEEFGMNSLQETTLVDFTSSRSVPSSSSAYTLMGHLAYKAHEYEKSHEFYQRALLSRPDGHLNWEAFEGLCQSFNAESDDDEPDHMVQIEKLFSPPEGASPDEYLNGYMELDDQLIFGAWYPATTDHQHPGGSLPIASNAPLNLKPSSIAPKDVFRIRGSSAINGRRPHPKRHMLIDTSFGQSSQGSSFAFNSFDRYPPHNKASKNQITNQMLPPPPRLHHAGLTKNGIGISPTPSTRQQLPQRLFNFAPPSGGETSIPGQERLQQEQAPISSTPNIQQGFGHMAQFTPSQSYIPAVRAGSIWFPEFSLSPNQIAPVLPPPPILSSQTGKASSVKRTRSQTQSTQGQALAHPAVESLSTNSSIPITTMVSASEFDRPDSLGITTTESSLIPSSGNPNLTNDKKNEATDGGRLLKVLGTKRENKRVKSNGNLLPPSSPLNEEVKATEELTGGAKYLDEKIEAIQWVENVMKRFGTAVYYLSRFRCEKALNELNGLPYEQKRSWRAYCLIGRAKFELLDYKSAEVAFKKARECFPHLVTHMDIYSTLLWHLRKTTSLSYLSQELQLIDPQAPETWIATGNLFSRLNDHPNALKCFQRSSQVSSSSEYGYTLSGHECLMLEEYSRSLIFFRESIRRSTRRNYNAYFGLGECYFKQEKYRLSLYFFNRAHLINPGNPLILSGIGKVYEALHRFEEALSTYDLALSVSESGRVASVRFSRAKVLFGLGDYQAAKEDLIELTKTVPTEFNVRFLLGKIYGIMGDRKRCIKELTIAQELEPRSSQQIKRILNDLNDHEKMEGLEREHLETEEKNIGNLTNYSV